MKMRARYISAITQEMRDDTSKYIITERKPNAPTPEDAQTEASEDAATAQTDLNNDEITADVEYEDLAEVPAPERKNWLGQLVDFGPWFGETAFTIGDRDITKGEVVGLSATVIVIIIVASVICCAISIWKRKAIAAGARRASQAVRASIRRMSRRGAVDPSDELPDKSSKEVVNDLDGTKAQKGFLKDMLEDQNNN